MILFTQCDDGMDDVAVLFLQLTTDRLDDTDDITDIAFLVFDSHVDDASVIGNAVKQSMDFDPAPVEFPAEIPGENHVGSALIRLVQHSVEDIFFILHDPSFLWI